MKRMRINRIAVALAATLAAAMALAAGDGTEPPAEPPPPRSEDAAPGTAGVRVYLDPQTGEVLERPTDPLTERIFDERLSTYSGDLLEEALPEGGFKVDLRGRFQTAVVATIDPETDEVEIDCISTPANGEARRER